MENLATASQGFGCFPFFLTNSVQSLLFGEKGREHQAEAFERNMQFRESMRSLQDAFHREQVDAQIAFRRESYELGRQYLIEQTLRENESRRKQAEFSDFCQNKTYWPLVVDIYTALSSRDDLIKYRSCVPLNVLIAWTDVSAHPQGNTTRGVPTQTPSKVYYSFCDQVAQELKTLPNIQVESAPWLAKSQSSVSDIYNINFILKGQPTLLVFPYQSKDGTLGIEMAAWSFNRGSQAMRQDKLMRMQSPPADKKQDAAVSAVKATIGMARDAYMLSEYRKPLVYNRMVDEQTLQLPEVRDTLSTYYQTMATHIRSDRNFRELCTQGEWEAIDASFTNTKHITA